MGKRKIKAIEIVEDITPRELNGGSFLQLERLHLKNVYDDGTCSRTYRCDTIHRRGVDSVVIIPYYRERTPVQKMMVLFVEVVRPAAYFRHRKTRLLDEQGREYLLFKELPAGSLEGIERGWDDICRKAAAELYEETGYQVDHHAFRSLGGGFFPSVGQGSEKIYAVAVEIDPEARMPTTGDGSVLEEDIGISFCEMREAIAQCRRGEIEDAKTEICLYRLAAELGYNTELS